MTFTIKKGKYVLLLSYNFFGSVLLFTSKKDMITFLALASNFALLDFERFDVIFDLFLMRLAERFIGWIIPKKVRVKCTRMVIFGKYFPKMTMRVHFTRTFLGIIQPIKRSASLIRKRSKMTSNLSKSNKAKFDANARNVIISFFDVNKRTEPKKL